MLPWLSEDRDNVYLNLSIIRYMQVINEFFYFVGQLKGPNDKCLKFEQFLR